MVVIKSSLEMSENKAKILDMIRDFVRIRPLNPEFRYEHIKAYIEKSRENKEVSFVQHDFLLRVLEVEYGMALVQKKEEEEQLRGGEPYGG